MDAVAGSTLVVACGSISSRCSDTVQPDVLFRISTEYQLFFVCLLVVQSNSPGVGPIAKHIFAFERQQQAYYACHVQVDDLGRGTLLQLAAVEEDSVAEEVFIVNAKPSRDDTLFLLSLAFSWVILYF